MVAVNEMAGDCKAACHVLEDEKRYRVEMLLDKCFHKYLLELPHYELSHAT